jgi:hypothetical protein
VHKADNLPPYCAVVTKSGNLNFLEPSGALRACDGTALRNTGGTGKTDQTQKREEELSDFNCGYVLLHTGLSLIVREENRLCVIRRRIWEYT